MIADPTLPIVLPRTTPTETHVGRNDHPINSLSDNSTTLNQSRLSQPCQLRMEVLRGTDGLAKLAPHWDTLLEQNAVRTPFMRWDWAELWWKQYESDFQGIFGAAWTEDGALVALVPLCIGPGQSLVRRRLRVVSFFTGLGEVVAEGLDFMALSGHEETLARLIDLVFQEIASEWDIAHFGYADEKAPFSMILARALDKHGVNKESRNAQKSPVIHLKESCWEDYLMNRTANFRKKYRRNWAAAKRDHEMVIRELDDRVNAPWFVEQLHRLHSLRWSAEESLFLRPRVKAFHKELAARWAVEGRVVLLLMEFCGKPVAANYAFIEGDNMWDYQGGWDVEHIDLSPAKLINAENVRRAMARGMKAIDMLPGDLEYKSKWTQTFREVADVEACNANSVRARIFQSIRTVKDSLAKLFPEGTTQS